MRVVKAMYENGKKEYTFMCTEDIKKGDRIVVYGTNDQIYRNEKELKILNVTEDSVEFDPTQHFCRKFILAHIDVKAYQMKQDVLTEMLRNKEEEKRRAAEKDQLLKVMQRHVANHVAIKMIEEAAKEDKMLANMLEEYRRL